MGRRVWVIQSTGFPGPTHQEAVGSVNGGRATTKTSRRRFGLRSKGQKGAPADAGDQTPVVGTRGAGQSLPLSAVGHGIWAAPDTLPQKGPVPPGSAPTATPWFDTEPAWLDPTGPRRAQGAYPGWTILCGTLVGGPFRWVLEHRAGGRTRWVFLSVSGRPTPDEFADQIAPLAGRAVASALVTAIRRSLPDCIAAL